MTPHVVFIMLYQMMYTFVTGAMWPLSHNDVKKERMIRFSDVAGALAKGRDQQRFQGKDSITVKLRTRKSKSKTSDGAVKSSVHICCRGTCGLNMLFKKLEGAASDEALKKISNKENVAEVWALSGNVLDHTQDCVPTWNERAPRSSQVGAMNTAYNVLQDRHVEGHSQPQVHQ